MHILSGLRKHYIYAYTHIHMCIHKIFLVFFRERYSVTHTFMGKGHFANNSSYFNFTLLRPFKMKLSCFRSVWVGHPLRAACVREA